MTPQSFATRSIRYPLALLGLLSLAACANEPRQLPAPPAEPPPDTAVYFYPAQGHAVPTAEQQDRDKYECNSWAVQKTGFDPSLPNVPPHQRVRVIAGGPPPGAATAAGAVTGAVVGAAVSNPWHAGRGTLIGALAGAAIGGIADVERSSEADRLQAQAQAEDSRVRNAALEQRAMNFRRAMSACLEGRGYSVR